MSHADTTTFERTQDGGITKNVLEPCDAGM